MCLLFFTIYLTEREKDQRTKDQHQRDQSARRSANSGGVQAAQPRAAGDGYGAAGIPSGVERVSAAASSRPAGPAAGSAAGRAAADGAGRGAEQNWPSAGLRSRQSQSQRGPKPLYTTPFGGKYHCDRECHGLRHASQICLTPRCHRCGPQSDTPQYVLFAISHGYALHVDYEHCRDAGSNGPIRVFNPCGICFTVKEKTGL